MKGKRKMSTVSMSGQDRKKKLGRKFAGVLIMVSLLVVTVLGATVYLLLKKSELEVEEGLIYEANAIAGDIPDKSKEGRQRELNSMVEEGMLAMFINATPNGPGTDRNRSVNWLIEDPSNQGKLMRMKVYRGDTGEKIYETGAIKPGNYVESAPPDTDPPVGEHDCTIHFYTHCLGAEEYIGQAVVRIRPVIYERDG